MSRRPRIAPEVEKAELKTLLHYLGLHTVAETYEDLLAQAAKGNWPHKKLLEALASSEAASKKERSVQARIATAHFPVIKTIDAFDFAFPKAIPKEQILSAFSLDFLERHEGFVFLGGPGTGKSHLATALGYAACLRGARMRFSDQADQHLGASRSPSRSKAITLSEQADHPDRAL